MLNKKNELEAIVQEDNPNIIAVTEIKAKRQLNINLVEYNIPGYTLFINNNPHLGVALYIKNDLNPSECIELNNHEFQEAVWCNFLSENNDKILIGCIYKSPNSTEDNVNNLLKLLNEEEINKYDKVCIVGDFNYPNINWRGVSKNYKDQKFVECSRDIFLHQMVCNPTRRREGQCSTLDDLVFL